MSGSGTGLRIEDDGGVRTLVLDRVEVRNALSLELRRALPEALATAADLDATVAGFCAALAAAPPLPLGLARLGLDRSLDTPLDAFLAWEADAVALCLSAPEHRQRVSAFVAAKRAKE